jgi:hypothetical protein
VALLAVGLVASLGVARERIAVEQRNRTVDIVLDSTQVQDLCATWDVPLGQALMRFREAGVSGVAVSETTISELHDEGRLQVNGAASILGDISPFGLEWTEPALRSLAAKVPGVDFFTPHAVGGRQNRPVGLIWTGSMEQLDRIGLGMPEDQVEAIHRAGLHVVARLRNYPGVNAAALQWMISEAARQGATAMICDENEVLGFREFIPETARLLNERNIAYGSVEFGKQLGDIGLGQALQGKLVRVHSITETEMLTMSPQRAIDRFELAVTDRNQRICYVRLFSEGKPDPVSANVDYISRLASVLRRDGYEIGVARPFDSLNPPRWMLLLIALGVAAAAMILLTTIFPLGRGWQWLVFAMIALVLVGAVAAKPDLGRKVAALAAALIFPVLALVGTRRIIGWDDAAPRRGSLATLIGRSLLLLVAASGISLIGGLMIGALLADRMFLVKVDEFSGVKLAFVLPLLATAAVFVGSALAVDSWPSYRARVRGNFARFLANPLLVGQCALLAVALGAVAFLMMRTANEPAVGVSGLELKLRGLLEHVLVVRPRTKEFLIGHPALMLLAALVWCGRRRWAVPLVVIAIVGQIDIINTYCHLHTNLLISLWRTANGLWTGALVGVAAILVWHFAGWLRPAVRPPERPADKS